MSTREVPIVIITGYLGSGNYIESVCFQTSEEYRHQGIGRKLFARRKH